MDQDTRGHMNLHLRGKRALVTGSTAGIGVAPAVGLPAHWRRAGHGPAVGRHHLGVLTVQADSLDHEYLDRWARRLNVADLLSRARGQEPR